MINKSPFIYLSYNKIGGIVYMKTHFFKKIVALFLCGSFCLMGFCVSAQEIKPPDIEITTPCVLLYNADTDRVIYAKNADEKRDPAGLVQLMTAAVVLDRVEDIEKETATARAVLFNELYGHNYPTADVRQGETLTIRQLLYCMMVQNSYEAASVLADYVSEGSMAYFAQMMNQKAKELGMTNSKFVNAHGMEEMGQYTTCSDLLKLAKYCMSKPELATMVKTTAYTIPANNRHSTARNLYTANGMLNSGSAYYYASCTGLKAAGVRATGRGAVLSANYNGLTYYAIMLGSDMYDKEGEYIPTNNALLEARELFRWVFSSYSIKNLLDTKSPCAQVDVRLSSKEDYVLLYPQKQFSDLVVNEANETSVLLRPIIPESVDAPVEKGQEIGLVEIVLAGEVIGKIPLVAEKDVPRSQVRYLLQVAKDVFASPWALAVLALVFLLFVAYIIFAIIHNQNRRKKVFFQGANPDDIHGHRTKGRQKLKRKGIRGK